MTQAGSGDMASATDQPPTPPDSIMNPAKFGAVNDAAVVIDKVSGRSRGFGFCTFASPDIATSCVASRHKIDGVSCEVRQAIPRDVAQDIVARYDSVPQPGKAFVGGLSDSVTEEQLVAYFQRFGPIREASLMYDKGSHKPRGFGFVTFEREEDVQQALGPHPELSRLCDVKLAEPKPATATPRYNRGRCGTPQHFRARDRGGFSAGNHHYYRMESARRASDRWFYSSGHPHSVHMYRNGTPSYAPPSGPECWRGRVPHHREPSGRFYRHERDYQTFISPCAHAPYDPGFQQAHPRGPSYSAYDTSMPFEPSVTPYAYRPPYSSSSSSHFRSRRARPYEAPGLNRCYPDRASSTAEGLMSSAATETRREESNNRPPSYWVAPPDYITARMSQTTTSTSASNMAPEAAAPLTVNKFSGSPPSSQLSSSLQSPVAAAALTDQPVSASTQVSAAGCSAPSVSQTSASSLRWSGEAAAASCEHDTFNAGAPSRANGYAAQDNISKRSTAPPLTSHSSAPCRPTTTVASKISTDNAPHSSSCTDVQNSAEASFGTAPPTDHVSLLHRQQSGEPPASVCSSVTGTVLVTPGLTVPVAGDPYQSHKLCPPAASNFQPSSCSSVVQKPVTLQSCDVKASTFHDPYAVSSASFSRPSANCGAAAPLSS